MTKEKQVKIELSVYQAAAVRQILFESQKGYTYDETSVPPRITDVRNVIQNIDEKIDNILD